MKHCPLCGSYISKINLGEAAQLFQKGWSLKRLGDKYGVTCSNCGCQFSMCSLPEKPLCHFCLVGPAPPSAEADAVREWIIDGVARKRTKERFTAMVSGPLIREGDDGIRVIEYSAYVDLLNALKAIYPALSNLPDYRKIVDEALNGR